MSRLAGYSAGRSVCARGGTVGAIRNAECAIRNFGNELIRRCDSIAVFCVWFTPAVRFCWDVWRSVHACRAVLLGCLAFGSRLPCGSVGMSGVWFTPAVRFCWDVWRLVHACRAVLLGCLASVHACLFSFVRKRETACGILRSYSAGSRSPLERSRIAMRLSGFVGSLRVCPFLCGDPDGVTKERGWRRGLCALLRRRIDLAGLSAGSTLGLRAPDCAKEPLALWTLFTLRLGCLGA